MDSQRDQAHRRDPAWPTLPTMTGRMTVALGVPRSRSPAPPRTLPDSGQRRPWACAKPRSAVHGTATRPGAVQFRPWSDAVSCKKKKKKKKVAVLNFCAVFSWGAASRVIYELSGGPFLSGLRSQQPPSRWWLGAGAQGRFASSLAPMSRSVALRPDCLCFRQPASRLRPGDASAKLSGGGRLGFFLGRSP